MLNWTGIVLSYAYTHLRPLFILSMLFHCELQINWMKKKHFEPSLCFFHCEVQINRKKKIFEQSLCFFLASRKYTGKFCKVWKFKGHLIIDYTNDYSSCSSDSPFSVSDKTSDESDTTAGSSRVAAIITYICMHVCGSVIQHDVICSHTG